MKKIKVILTVIAVLFALLVLEQFNMTESLAAIILGATVFVWIFFTICLENVRQKSKR